MGTYGSGGSAEKYGDVTMPFYREEQLEAARRMTAIEYLQKYQPYRLKKSSARNEWELTDHDSFKINGITSKWHWKSRDIGGNARVAGEAVVSESVDGYSPLIGGTSMVYGTVSGRFIIKDIVLLGENYRNPSPDLFILENGKREILVKERKLKPPKQAAKEKIKRDLER